MPPIERTAAPTEEFPGYLRSTFPTVKADPDRPVELNGHPLDPDDARDLARALLDAADVSEAGHTRG